MNLKLESLHFELQNHPIYRSLENQLDLRVFMKWHSFAVWDFMSLLKSLQNSITCTSVPWKPSPFPKDLVRFINEIVLGEESDELATGGYSDHFSMYLNAMDEIEADKTLVENFLVDLNFEILPTAVRDFVAYNINLAMVGKPHEVCAAFFYGRENLVPSIFTPIVCEIREHQLDCQNFLYYLERHIELDGQEHGILAQKCLDILVDGDRLKLEEAMFAAQKSLLLRRNLWDFITTQIVESKDLSCFSF